MPPPDESCHTREAGIPTTGIPTARRADLAISRRALLGGVLGGAALAAGQAVLRPAAAAAQSDPLGILFARINDYRAGNGRPRLPLDHQLAVVSQRWSEAMRDRGGLSHNSGRMAEWGWAASSDGEVVGYATGGDLTSRAHRVVDAWIASAPHRRILLGDWTDLGIGWTEDAGGTLWATANCIATPLPSVGQQALEVSRQVLADGSATRIVLVRDDLPADGLAAVALVDGTTPLFLVRAGQHLPDVLLAEISRVAAPGATVHLVGGALPDAILHQVRGLGATPARLRGANRYETAALVAREVARLRGRPRLLLIANGEGWADAASAGAFAAAYGTPLLLTTPGALHPAARSVLQDFGDVDRAIVGGEAAVAEVVAHEAGAWRLTGRDRAETGARVMRDAWAMTARPGATLIVSPGWTGDGWATALATSTLAARDQAPLLYSGAGLPAPVASALGEAGFGPGAPANLWFARNVPAATRDQFLAVAT